MVDIWGMDVRRRRNRSRNDYAKEGLESMRLLAFELFRQGAQWSFVGSAANCLICTLTQGVLIDYGTLFVGMWASYVECMSNWCKGSR